MRALREKHPLKARAVPINFIYLHPTPTSLASYLSNLVHGSGVNGVGNGHYDEAAELQTLLDSYIADLPKPGDRVLLTGSTGSFGANILAQLIASPTVERVYAFARRSSDGSSIRERHARALKRAGWDADLLDSKKVILVEGDLGAKDFNVVPELFIDLRSSVTHIIHNAWRVDFNLSVASFKPDVLGVQNLVKFALQCTTPKPPRLLFVSSIGVFRQPKTNGLAVEEAIDNPEVVIGSGYSKSKWLAEQILTNAAKQASLKVVIVRLGQVTGGPSGGWNEHEWFPSLIKSSVALKCLPDTAGAISWLPSETAAAALIEMRNSEEQYLHLVHPNPVSWTSMIQEFSKALNLPVVSYGDWLSALEDSLSKSSDDEAVLMQRIPALRLLEFFRHVKIDDPKKEPLGVSRLSTEKAVKVSSRLRDPSLPQVGGRDVRKWVSSWKGSSFLS